MQMKPKKKRREEAKEESVHTRTIVLGNCLPFRPNRKKRSAKESEKNKENGFLGGHSLCVCAYPGIDGDDGDDDDDDKNMAE